MAYVIDRRGAEVGQCSGTVVAANLVLTAGHCAEDMQNGVVNEAAGYQVVTGNVDWAAPVGEEQVSGVSRVIPCPCLDRHTMVGDVALLELSTPTAAPPITLASAPRAGTEAVFAGWGETYPKEPDQVEQVRAAPTITQRPEWCEREAPAFSPRSEICVIDPPARQTGACEGDSGGPLLVTEPEAVGGMVQIGVVSHGYGECATTSPSVFTRVDAVAAWIRGWARALAQATPAAASAPSGLVAAPTLPGIASVTSLTLIGSELSLVLSCDRDGGACRGEVAASIAVRRELLALRGGRRTVLSRHTRRFVLGATRFAIAPGAGTTVRVGLSSQSRSLLSSLAGGPTGILLTGRGIVPRVASL
jgi:secreted trypsin-like serine protease